MASARVLALKSVVSRFSSWLSPLFHHFEAASTPTSDDQETESLIRKKMTFPLVLPGESKDLAQTHLSDS